MKNFSFIQFITVFVLLFTLSIGQMSGYTGSFSLYSTSTLIDGYYVVCGSSAKAMGNTVNSNKRIEGTAVTISSNSISNPADAIVWLIEEKSDNSETFTFKNYSSSKYLYISANSSGKSINVGTTAYYASYDYCASVGDCGTNAPIGFKFTLGASVTTDYTILKWNNSSSWFSGYSGAYTNSMTPVRLFRLAKFRAKTTQPASGSFTASATSATWDGTNKHLSWMSSGATVTLTASPPSGKTVNAWTVTKATGGTVTVTNNQFTMPADQVTISVTWKDAAVTSVTASPASITFLENTVEVGTDEATSTITLSNGYASYGNYLYGWFEDLSDEDHCEFFVNEGYTYSYTTSGSASPILTFSYLADAAGTYTGNFIIQGYNSSYTAVNCTIPLSVTITSACDYKVTLTKSAATNGTFTLHSGSASGTEIASGGEVDNCESDAIVYVVPSPSTGYQTGTVSATNKKTLDTDGDNTVLTYAKGSNIASTVSVTFEAKTYTIDFNQTTSVAEPASGGESSVTATYADDCPTIASLPTKEHYNFAGYWTEAGGTGTQVVNADGTWISTVSGYTKNGKWDRDGGVTLHAKWTAKSYTITWQTRGDSWAGKGGSTTANYGAAWSTLTLPTDPDPTDDDEGCGDKFVGWIVGTIDGELDKDDDAAAISALVILNSDTKSGLTGQTISGATTFNAVFADYDD